MMGWEEFSERHEEARRKREALLADGLLERPINELQTLEEIADYADLAYFVQSEAQRTGGSSARLPLAVAAPDVLIEQAIKITGAQGIANADLRRALSRIGKKRYELAMSRLEAAGMIVRSLERRPDAAGRRRDVVVWRAAEYADPRGPI